MQFYIKFSLLPGATVYIINAKIKMRQFFTFSNPRKFDTAEKK